MKKHIALIVLMLIFALLPSYQVSASTGINKKILTLNMSETYTLKVDGAIDVKWSSSDSNIATVSKKGVVSPVSPGTIYIYGKSNGVTYKCKLYITSSSKDYLAYEDEFVKIVYKGVMVDRLCFEFINKTDNYYFLRVKSFTIDDVLYEYYLYDSTFKGPSERYWNYKPGTNAKDDPEIKNIDFKNLSGKFTLCWMEKNHEEIEAIDFSIDIE